MVTLKYSEISNFNFAQAMEKISSTPVHGQIASQIHKVTKELNKVRQIVTKEYQDTLVEKYGKRDTENKIIRPDGEPFGFDCIEGKEEEFKSAQDAFGDNTININVQPFTVQMFGEAIKVSAKDLEFLKGLYVGNMEEEKTVLAAVK